MTGPYAKEETLDVPKNTPLPSTEELGPVPYVFVAFLLRGDILRRQARERGESSTSGLLF